MDEDARTETGGGLGVLGGSSGTGLLSGVRRNSALILRLCKDIVLCLKQGREAPQCILVFSGTNAWRRAWMDIRNGLGDSEKPRKQELNVASFER